MSQNLLIVSEQVAILFILIALGFVCGKIKLINETSSKHLTNIVLYFATPCIMIQSFQEVKYDDRLVINLAVAAICAIAIHIVSIVISRLIFRGSDESKRLVLRFAMVFSNCGFMSLPLQRAVLGSKGVFYGTVFVAVFNVIVWSYGCVDMSGGKGAFSIKKILLNPGVIGAATALLLFFLRIKLPSIILSPISYIAALNTPLPMLIIGYYLYKSNLKQRLGDKSIYAVSALRLIAVPLLALFCMKLCHVNSGILVSCIVAASAPTATMTAMFSAKFNRDTDTAVGVVSVTTLFSVLTMPVIIALAQTV